MTEMIGDMGLMKICGGGTQFHLRACNYRARRIFDHAGNTAGRS